MPSEKTKPFPSLGFLVRLEGSCPHAWVARRNPRVQSWSKEELDSQFPGFLPDPAEQNGEGRKAMRTQAIGPCGPGTLDSGAAIVLHYQPGPLEVSVVPRSFLRVGEQARRQGGLVVRSLRSENSGSGGIAERIAPPCDPHI